MAVTKQKMDADQLQLAISGINEKLGYGESGLSASPTAYSDVSAPSRSDLATEVNIRKLQRQKDILESQLLQEKWYGPKKAPEEMGGKRQMGALEYGLKTISAPLHAIVGGVESLTGTGSAPGWQNIAANIKEGSNFGDILRKKGAPEAVAMPFGFALDVMFDPINWATAGTAALIPRVGAGLVKGGVKGAAKGLESGLLQKAATVSRLVPGQKKAVELSKVLEKEGKNVIDATAEEMSAIGLKGVSKNIAKLHETAVRSADEFNKIIKTDLDSILKERELLLKKGGLDSIRGTYLSAGDIAKEAVSKLPFGESLLKAFDYDPGGWFRVSMLKDRIYQLYEEKGKLLGKKFDPRTGKEVIPTKEEIEAIVEGGKITDNVPLQSIDDVLPVDPLGKRINDAPRKKLSDIIDEGVAVTKAPQRVVSSNDPIENARRLLGEAKEEYDFKDLIKAVAKLEEDKTGVKWFDNLRKGLNEIKAKNGTPWATNTLDVYMGAINLFKAAKVSVLSPSAVMNAVIGNMAMGAMMGFNILRKEFLGRSWQAYRFLQGKGSVKFIDEIKGDHPEIYKFLEGHPSTFGRIIGLGPMDFTNRVNREMLIDLAKKEGKKLTEEQLLADLRKANDYVRNTPIQALEKKIKDGVVSAEDLPTSFSAELYGSSKKYLLFKQWAADNKNSSVTAKALDFVMNRAVSEYEKIDQAYKLGGFTHMTIDGLEEGSILAMSRFVPMKADDIVEKYKSGGRYLYRLSPERALEVVNKSYMNYSAMPGAVKVLRSLPIVGAPFASFSYGMGAKTIETALYNPTIFNKINYLMSEISGPKTPLEKEAMAQGYYTNFSQAGMVKLPFFRENPVYLNMANMIPYYSFNMFSDNGRKYSDQFPDRMASYVDSMPFLKDPVGQILFDYFIQPMIMQGENPQNAFGAPLYPSSASAPEKGLYAARQLGEAFVPNLPGAVAGLAAGALPTPEGVIETVPSFRFRGLARAVRGEDVLGMARKEDPTSRTIRLMFATAGIPLSQMDLDFIANNILRKK